MSTGTPTLSIPCALCEADLVAPAEPLLGELLPCTTCGGELEVVSVSPLEIAEAPPIQEDWGE